MREGESTEKNTVKQLIEKSFIRYFTAFYKLNLSADEIHALNIICSFEFNNKVYTGSSKYLCELLNISKPKALRILKSLTEKNYLIKENSNGYHSSIYKINFSFVKSKLENSNNMLRFDNETVTICYSKQLQSVTVNSNNLLSNKNIYKNNNKNIYAQSEIDADTTLSKVDDDTSKQKKSPSNKKNDEIYIQRFDKFWEIYPKKKDKARAFKTWLKLKPNDELFNTIMTAVKEQAQSDQWQKDDGQYIPYPSTWLNGERWNDEIKKAVHITPPPKEEEYKPVGNFKPIY